MAERSERKRQEAKEEAEEEEGDDDDDDDDDGDEEAEEQSPSHQEHGYSLKPKKHPVATVGKLSTAHLRTEPGERPRPRNIAPEDLFLFVWPFLAQGRKA